MKYTHYSPLTPVILIEHVNTIISNPIPVESNVSLPSVFFLTMVSQLLIALENKYNEETGDEEKEISNVDNSVVENDDKTIQIVIIVTLTNAENAFKYLTSYFSNNNNNSNNSCSGNNTLSLTNAVTTSFSSLFTFTNKNFESLLFSSSYPPSSVSPSSLSPSLSSCLSPSLTSCLSPTKISISSHSVSKSLLSKKFSFSITIISLAPNHKETDNELLQSVQKYLFSSLRLCDEPLPLGLNGDLIIFEGVERKNEGAAIMNRVSKAAKVILN
jgi:hypothetical protein